MSNTLQPKYPDIVVKLSGEDGNGFAIVGRVSAAMRRGGVSQNEVDAFTAKALSNDYDTLLRTAMETVTVA